MKKKKVHKDQFGYFNVGFQWDRDGFIEMHSSSRYRCASEIVLSLWTKSRNVLVRNAAYGEINRREMKKCSVV